MTMMGSRGNGIARGAAAEPAGSLRAFARLLGIQMRATLYGFGVRRGSGAWRALGVLALAALIAALVAIYMNALGRGMVAAGAAAAIPALAVLLGSFAAVAFTFVKAPGTVFGCRDFDAVAALPVPTPVVVAARVAPLFAMGAGMSLVLSVPLFAAYFSVVAPAPASVAAAVWCAILAPCAPLAVALLASLALTAVAVRFRHAGAAQLVLSVLFAGAILVGSFMLGGTQLDADDASTLLAMGDAAGVITAAIARVYPPAAWAAGGVAAGGGWGLVWFTALSLAVPVAVTALLAARYAAVQALATARVGRRGGGAARQAHEARAAHPLRALVAKELRTIASMPAYALNTCMGLLLMVLAAGAIAWFGVDALLVSGVIDGVELDAVQVAALRGQIDAAVPWVFGFCGAISLTAGPSVSLEGGAAWIMFTIPLSRRAVLASKLMANLLLGAVAIAVSACLLLAGGMSPLLVLQCGVATAGMLAGFASIALSLDARHPRFSYIAPTEVIKRGLPMMVGSLGGVVATGLCGVGAVLIATVAGGAAAMAFNLAAPLLIAAFGLICLPK